MRKDLQNYLFRTIYTKPSGLKVRLTIKTITRNLITFEETNLPAASIMWHGLFLERPTQMGVRDPMLVAVINQKQLSNDEVKVGFGIYSEAVVNPHGQSEFETRGKPIQCLHPDSRLPYLESNSTSTCSQLTEQIVSISRFGIVKHLPMQVPIHLQQKTNSNSNSEATNCQNFYYCMMASDWSDESAININSDQPRSPFLIRPYDILIGLLEDLIKIPKKTSSKSSLGQIMPDKSPNNPKIDLLVRPPNVEFDSGLNKLMRTWGSMLRALQTSIHYLGGFEPSRIPKYSRVFDFVWQRTHLELGRLASLLRDLVLRPLAEVTKEISDDPLFEKFVDVDLIQENMIQSLEITENLIEVSKKQILLGRIAVKTLIEPQIKPRIPTIQEETILCLLHAQTMKTFCSKVEASMQNHSFSCDERNQNHDAKSRNLANWLTHASTAGEFSQISEISLASRTHHKVCQTMSARGGVQRINIGPTLYGESHLRLDAAFSSQGNTFLVVSGDSNIPIKINLPEPERITHLKLFRGELEIASYQIFAIDPRKAFVGFNHFTSRYLLSIEYHWSIPDWSHLQLLDLAPCMKQHPEPPTVIKHKLTDLLGQKVTDDELMACTDEFLSYYFIDSKMDLQRQTCILTKASLCIVRFDATILGQSPVKICLTDEYRKITNLIGIPAPKCRKTAYKQICWSNRKSTLFHAIWDSDHSKDLHTLLIACYEVGKSLDGAKLVTFSYTHQKEYLPHDLYGKYSPHLHTLRTEIREYLVVDITSIPTPDKDPCSAGERSVRVLGRLLFTLHKNKLQRVLVNGQHLYRFPAYIGNRIGYAGYESSHLSLFHHRRVFSTDKVMSAVYRLDYKPL